MFCTSGEINGMAFARRAPAGMASDCVAVCTKSLLMDEYNEMRWLEGPCQRAVTGSHK